MCDKENKKPMKSHRSICNMMASRVYLAAEWVHCNGYEKLSSERRRSVGFEYFTFYHLHLDYKVFFKNFKRS